MKYAMFSLVILLDAVGLILEKKGMTILIQHHDKIPSLNLIYHAITNLYLISGIALCTIGLVLWLYVLSQFNLSYIYPLGSLLYIIVAILSYYFLSEPLTGLKLAGIGVIILGCILINL